MGTQKNRLSETIRLSTYNIGFAFKNKREIVGKRAEYPSLSGPLRTERRVENGVKHQLFSQLNKPHSIYLYCDCNNDTISFCSVI